MKDKIPYIDSQLHWEDSVNASYQNEETDNRTKPDNRDAFIGQTAQDYDIPYHIAEGIYKKHTGIAFYEKLEEYIKNRSHE